jgi:hypothetical protein
MGRSLAGRWVLVFTIALLAGCSSPPAEVTPWQAPQGRDWWFLGAGYHSHRDHSLGDFGGSAEDPDEHAVTFYSGFDGEQSMRRLSPRRVEVRRFTGIAEAPDQRHVPLPPLGEGRPADRIQFQPLSELP